MTSISASNSIYIRQSGGDIEYKADNADWDTIISWPLTISSTNPIGDVLPILFTTDITFDSVDQYFVCANPNLQFGSKTLNTDGSRPTININVNDYPGLIQNGTDSNNGVNDIYILNLIVDGSGGTLAEDAGWICQSYYSKLGSGNFIVNCSSIGDILSSNSGAGGIVGAFATLNGGTLKIIGCNSTGSIGDACGGIVGGFAGQDNGTIIVSKCWSSGSINGSKAGGIVGTYAGVSYGSIIISECFSLGNIESASGGIVGTYASDTSGNVAITACYTRGDITAEGGGIVGGFINGSGTISVTNCYSSGASGSSTNGIVADSSSGVSIANCYAAYDSWSDSAASQLQGYPISSNVGTIWTTQGVNKPFNLTNFGYTPYQLQNITSSGQNLITQFNATVDAGNKTINAVIGSLIYSILGITGGVPASYGTITINSTTGEISTLGTTKAGTYQIYVGNIGYFSGYNSTIVNLTVNSSGPPPPPPNPTSSSISQLVKGSRGITSSMVTDLRGAFAAAGCQGNKQLKFTSIDQYINFKKAIAKRTI